MGCTTAVKRFPPQQVLTNFQKWVVLQLLNAFHHLATFIVIMLIYAAWTLSLTG
jgi:hypothetical protein